MPSVKLENKSARILHIGLGSGEVVTVPPSDPSTGGAITIEMDDAEHERFTKALDTPAVQEWIAAGELVIDGEAADELEDDEPAEDDEEV